MSTATADFETWLGLVLISSGEAGEEDRVLVLQKGLTVLGEEDVAGLTRLYVSGDVFAVTAMQEYETKIRIPSLFFSLRKGEEISLTRAKQWTAKKADLINGATIT